MSSFYLSFRDAVGNFGLQLVNSWVKPKGIYTHYSRRSIALVGTFLCANLFNYAKEQFVDKYSLNIDKKSKESDESKNVKRGDILFLYFYVLVVYSWDTVHKCYMLHTIPDFFTVMQQGTITIATLYIIMFLITLLPYYNYVAVTLPFYVTNALEGGIIFVLYNWIVNLRERFKYNSCTQLSIIEVEKNALLNTKDKVGWLYKEKPTSLYVSKKSYVNDAEFDSGSSVYVSKDLDYVRLS